jgi:hypothetical protein
MIPLIIGAIARVAGSALARSAATSAVEGGVGRAAASGVTKSAQFANTVSKVNTASNIVSRPQTNPQSSNTTPSNPGAMTSISEN